MNANTMDEYRQLPAGTKLLDESAGDYRIIVRRGSLSLIGCIGVPRHDRLWGQSHKTLPVDVHQGMHFSGEGNGIDWPSGWWWFGWTYQHAGDAMMVSPEMPAVLRALLERPGKEWTVNEVFVEALDFCSDLSRLSRQMGQYGEFQETETLGLFDIDSAVVTGHNLLAAR
jgi:hypothetical protein